VTANCVPEGVEFEVGVGAGLQELLDEAQEEGVGDKFGSGVASSQPDD
jgi:hypothetical protein